MPAASASSSWVRARSCLIFLRFLATVRTRDMGRREHLRPDSPSNYSWNCNEGGPHEDTDGTTGARTSGRCGGIRKLDRDGGANAREAGQGRPAGGASVPVPKVPRDAG